MSHVEMNPTVPTAASDREREEKYDEQKMRLKAAAMCAINLWLDWYNDDQKQNEEVMIDVLLNDYIVPLLVDIEEKALTSARQQERQACRSAVEEYGQKEHPDCNFDGDECELCGAIHHEVPIEEVLDLFNSIGSKAE